MKLKDLCKVVKVNKTKEDSLKAGMIGIDSIGFMAGTVNILSEDSNNRYIIGIDANKEIISNKHLCEVLQSMDLISLAKGSTLQRIYLSDVKELDITI